MKSRLTRLGAVLLLVSLCWLLFAPQQLGGSLTYVTTQGASMAPQFQTGDLAVLRPVDEYAVGDVAAYHSPMLDTIVMHRIVAIEDHTYTLRGDNNDWLDPETLTHDQMAGKLLLRVPHGGTWLGRLTSPVGLGLITFILLATGGTAVRTRRTSRSRRNQTMRSDALHFRPATSGMPSMRGATTAVAATGLAGLALGLLTWTNPGQEAPAPNGEESQSVTFSYKTTVPDSPAYDDTTVTSPQPVFRKLANTVDVHVAYRGQPGTMAVAAELSSPNGWRSTVPLAATKAFSVKQSDTTVTLDLDALERRAQAAAKTIGMPTEEVGIKIIPTVRSEDGETFAPELSLTLTPLQLTLTGEPTTLAVADAGDPVDEATGGLTVPVLGRSLPNPIAWMISAALVLAALLGAGALRGAARRPDATTEAASILRRYGSLVAPVHPMPTPAGRPVIEVTDFATLARLAERYGLLILHWSRSDVTTFLVQDEGATYRYRTGAGLAASEDRMVDAEELDRPAQA